MTDFATQINETESLWVTDAELIRRAGVPEKVAREALRALDANPRSGFPQKKALWGKRRYWPHVKAYFERTSGLTIPVPQGDPRHE